MVAQWLRIEKIFHHTILYFIIILFLPSVSHAQSSIQGKVVGIADGDTIEKVIRDSETDILVVFESSAKKRFALHIENKLGKGHFTQYQPEMYSERAKLWQGNKRYCEYTDYETVLIAPIEFYRRNFEDANKFDRYVSYEEISILLPIFEVNNMKKK